LQRYLKEGDKEVDGLRANLEQLDKEGDPVGVSIETLEIAAEFLRGPPAEFSSTSQLARAFAFISRSTSAYTIVVRTET
jgi:hypothetical protein